MDERPVGAAPCRVCGRAFRTHYHDAVEVVNRHTVPRSDANPGPAWARPECAGSMCEPAPVTKTGRVLTDAVLDALADEAERGYDVSNAKPRPVVRLPGIWSCSSLPANSDMTTPDTHLHNPQGGAT